MEKLASEPQARTSDSPPPLARVMGVGRQQRQAMYLMRRFNCHEKALSVERRVRTLMLEEVDPVPLKEERTISLDVGELNENIETLTKLLANMNMAEVGRRMSHVKCIMW